jgi:glycine cleavage system H lipoate-binding protein
MTFILVILTVAIILSVEVLRKSRKSQRHESPELVTEHPTSFEVFDRYFHPGHTWAMVSGSRNVIVGIDDFSSRIIGAVERIELPSVGRTVRQGEPLTFLRHGTRNLAQVAPISGKVVDVNGRLAHHPELLNESPLERGWIAKIVPTSFETDLRNLLKGVVADGWRDAVRLQLVQLFSPKIGIVIQDGGQLVQNFGDHLSDDEWNRLVQQFFPTVLPNQYPTKSMN